MCMTVGLCGPVGAIEGGLLHVPEWIAHRGPDGGGTYLELSARCGLRQ